MGDFGLSERGRDVLEAARAGRELNAAELAVAVEAARAADRLEQLDGIVRGKGVLKLMRFRVRHAVDEDGVVAVEMSVDDVLNEARLLQASFASLVKLLKIPESVPVVRSDAADDLAKRRAERRRKAAGS